MAIIVGDKVYRNMQEQVAKNQDDIEELQEAVAQLPDTTYSKTEIDSKDADVLAEAKAYTYSKTESDEKFATITSVNTALETKFDKFVPTAGQVANIELYDEETYANLFIGVKGQNEATYKNYVSISSEGDVNIKADESFTMGVQNNSGTVLLGKNHDMEFTAQSDYDVNFKVGGTGKVCVTKTGAGALVKKEIALKEDIINVEANPAGSATASLSSLQVGSTVYSVGSGGGGTKYKHDMLLSITEDGTVYGSVHMIIINDYSSAYTISTLPGYLTSSTYFYPIYYGREYNNFKVFNDTDRIYLHAWYNNDLFFEEQDDYYSGQTYVSESINTFGVVLVNDKITTV